MLEPRKIPDLDHWLDELDQLVESGCSSTVFYQRTLSQLRLLLAADGVAIFVNEKLFAVDGHIDREAVDSKLPLSSQATSSHCEQSLVTVAIRKRGAGDGWLVANFGHEIPTAAAAAARELMSAVAEVIASFQTAAIEKFLNHDWPRLQSTLRSLRKTESKHEAAFTLVNELQALLNAVRVAIVDTSSSSGSKPTVLAVSNTEYIDQHSPIAVLMKQAAHAKKSETHTTEVLSEAFTLGSQLSPYRIVISLPLNAEPVSSSGISHSPSQRESKFALILEWTDTASKMDVEPIIRQFMPVIDDVWHEHIRWLALPTLVRRFANRSVAAPKTSRFIRNGLIGSLGSIALAMLLFWEQPFRIDATGTLQPKIQRSVFVSMDGWIEEILVEDGQTVVANQALIRLRSSVIDRELERVRGELATNREKRNGINVAVNEAAAETRNQSNSASTQAKLTTDLRVLEVEEEGLKRQLALLNAESARLTISAPIDGIIVAHDLRKYLDRRPVKRGDILFRIADVKGPWQIEMQIADKDSGYVKQHFVDTDQASTLDFALAADPKTEYTAKLTWLSPVAHRDADIGVVVDSRAAIDDIPAELLHLGGKIDAKLLCGKQPVWFIWSRPLVEAIQRRFWW